MVKIKHLLLSLFLLLIVLCYKTEAHSYNQCSETACCIEFVSSLTSQFEGKSPSALKEIPIVKNGDLFVANKDGKILRQLTHHKAVQSFLISPNGSYVVYIQANGEFSHLGVTMNFDGTLTLKIINILGTELRNVLLGKFQHSPSLEYFWDHNSSYVYMFFNQNYETKTEYREKNNWVQYEVRKNKNKPLTELEFSRRRKIATISIKGSADLTSFNYPIIREQGKYLDTLFNDLYSKISRAIKKTLSVRYRNSTIHSTLSIPSSYQYSSNSKKAFLLMTNIVFSPNTTRAAVYLEPTSCENMEYMTTFATPIFIIDLTNGEITEISEPLRFLSLVWMDDEKFLISDRVIKIVNLVKQGYTLKRFLPQNENFINSCEERQGPSMTLPCDNLGEALGPIEILTDPCSA